MGKNKYAREYKGVNLIGEINPTKIHHFYDGVSVQLNQNEIIFYEVLGTVFQNDTNTEFRFLKKFETFESAKTYLDTMVKFNPVSEIIIKEVKVKELLIYC